MGSDRLNSLWEIMESLWDGAFTKGSTMFNEFMKEIDVKAFFRSIHKISFIVLSINPE